MSKIALIFSALVFVAALFAGEASAQSYVTDGLIAMWTMDADDIDGDKVIDVTGNGNDATIVGKLEIVKGVIDECLKFDGGQNYVQIPDMGEFPQVSCECWAYQEDAASGIQGIVSTWQWAAGKVHFKFESNEIQVDKNGAGKIRAPRDLQTWYHIVYTTDTPTALKLYVNGELAAEGPGGAEPENWHERRIGSEHDGRYLNGMVDEVRVYDRVLTPDEVKQNYQVDNNETAVRALDKLATTWAAIK